MPIAPTPWLLDPVSETPFLRILSAPDANGARQVVALVDGIEREAHAALIVAAPSLLDAIRAGDFPAAAALVAALDVGAA